VFAAVLTRIDKERIGLLLATLMVMDKNAAVYFKNVIGVEWDVT
jgi:hypothetical protein